jgi:hypothetical protein
MNKPYFLGKIVLMYIYVIRLYKKLQATKHYHPAGAGGGWKESQQQSFTVLPCLRDAVRQEFLS